MLNEFLEIFWCLFSGINLARADSYKNLISVIYKSGYFSAVLTSPDQEDSVLLEQIHYSRYWDSEKPDRTSDLFRYFCTLFFKKINSNSEFFIMHNLRWLLMVSQLLIFLILFYFCIITFIKIAVWFKSLYLTKNLGLSTLCLSCKIAVSIWKLNASFHVRVHLLQ